MSEHTVTQDEVRKAWSYKVGKTDQYDLHEIETADGESQTQLIDKETGSITVAVNGTGPKVLKKLLDHAGDTFIDGGESPVSSTDGRSVKRYTSTGVLATPTQPEAMVSTQGPIEVTNDPNGRTEASAPVDRQPSTGAVQLTGEGGEKEFDDGGSSAPMTEGERAAREGIGNVVAREQAKKEGTGEGSDEDEGEVVTAENNPNAKLTELNERATELGVEGAGEFKTKDSAREAILSHQKEQE